MQSSSIYKALVDLILSKDFASADALLKELHDTDHFPHIIHLALMATNSSASLLKNRDMLYQQTKDRLVSVYGPDEGLKILEVFSPQ